MPVNLECVVDNTVKKWMKEGRLHREDGPAVIRGVGKSRVEEYWCEGCLVSQAMLELHRTLTPEVMAFSSFPRPVMIRKTVEGRRFSFALL